MEGVENEEIATQTILETKSLQNIQQQDIDDLDRFTGHEIDLYLQEADADKKKELGTSAYVHAFAVASLRDAMRDKNDFSLIIAKDTKGRVVGYSLVGIDPKDPDPLKKVKSVFLGVKWEERKKGIGTKLLKKRIEVLKDKGFKGYITDSRNEVRNLYDRLGVRYIAKPLPQGANNADIAQQLTVYTR